MVLLHADVTLLRVMTFYYHTVFEWLSNASAVLGTLLFLEKSFSTLPMASYGYPTSDSLLHYYHIVVVLSSLWHVTRARTTPSLLGSTASWYGNTDDEFQNHFYSYFVKLHTKYVKLSNWKSVELFRGIAVSFALHDLMIHEIVHLNT